MASTTPLLSPSLPRAARCAIALNNIGCALLERNCVDRAYATFYDALRVLAHHAATPEEDAPHDEEPLGTSSPSEGATRPQGQQLINDTLRKAELRLISASDASSSDGGDAAYRPIRYNASGPSLGAILSQVRHNYCHCLPIDATGAREDGMIPEEVLSVIVLINYANAGLGKALLQGGRHQDASQVARPVRAARVTPVDRALTIIRLAYSIVEKCDARSESTRFLELLILDTQLHVLREAEREREADELQAHLDVLCHFVEITLWFLYVHAPAACAA